MRLKGKLAAFEYKKNGEPLEPYLDLPEASDSKTVRALAGKILFEGVGAEKEATDYLETLFKVKIRFQVCDGELARVDSLNRHLNRAERFKLATTVLTGFAMRELCIGDRYRYGVYYRLDSEKRGKRELELENGVWREV